MRPERKRALLEAARAAVKRNGYGLNRLKPNGSLIRITKGDEELSCAVRVIDNPHRRVHFKRLPTGTYTTLSNVDRVLIVSGLIQAGQVMAEANMFEQSSVLEAFQENYRQAKAAGLGHLPQWISLDRETGVRHAASGFKERALWTEIVPLGSDPHDAAPEDKQAKTIGDPAKEFEEALVAFKKLAGSVRSIGGLRVEINIIVSAQSA
jgi:hypothetical protein